MTVEQKIQWAYGFSALVTTPAAEVNRRGDALTFFVFSVLAAIPLLLGMVGFDALWMTTTLFFAFAIAAVFGVIATSVIYVKGV